jgi:hypothetical protein
MHALQVDESTVPDGSVEHIANALVNLQVTAVASVTVPASTPVDPADKSAAAANVPASTPVDPADRSAASATSPASTPVLPPGPI